jgi:hypothetical protein
MNARSKCSPRRQTASKARLAEAENLRLENVALKLKLQQLKTRLDTPLANPTTVKMLRDLYGQVKQLKAEKDVLAGEVQDSLDTMGKISTLVSLRGCGCVGVAACVGVGRFCG